MTLFKDLDLHKLLHKGLKDANFLQMTPVQQQSLPITLQSKDLLCAAKTGSGKTLAFLIPALNLLFSLDWTSFDGLGILILSPTRELALQIFKEVFHSLYSCIRYISSTFDSKVAKDWKIFFFFCWITHWR
jgi:ATP-dependent RNA helicase DDX10/DBP4